MFRSKPIITFWACLAALLGLVYLLYQPALSGSFHFDDSINLQGLETVEDFGSAVSFVFSSAGGPLGRPMSMASFILNQSAWPVDPKPFLQLNILIHLLNGILVACLALKIGRLLPNWTDSPEGFGLTVAGLWLLQPLLASTSLLIIQRMTSLAATFVLLGLLLYLFGRIQEVHRPRVGRWWMLLAIYLFTPLAVLNKENGILLPLYILVLEATLLAAAGLKPSSGLARWRFLALGIPLAGTVAYVVTRLPGLPASYEARTFTLYERLLTQAHVLWDYLRLIFLPRPLSLGPLHDDYPVAGTLNEPSTLLAVVSWIVIFGLAVKLRRRYPVGSFAALWFLAGHALESSIFSLELYFEHRNYLPAIGPLLAVALWLHRFCRGSLRRLLPGILALYLGLLAFVLLETTTLWGDPQLATELWYMEHPGSVRAAQGVANYYAQQGDQHTAHKVIRESYQRHLENTALVLQNLQTWCDGDHYDRVRQLLQDMEPVLSQGYYDQAAIGTLDKLLNLATQDACPPLNHSTILNVADALLNNRNYRSTNHVVIHNLHIIKSRVYLLRGNLSLTLDELFTAYKLHPNMDTARLIKDVFQSAGLYDEAVAFLLGIEKNPPGRLMTKSFNEALLREWIEAIRARTSAGESAS